jgi:1-acyl-sn-glycerol-3-phosphate acyltransferase
MQYVREGMRGALLRAAGYNVEFEGTFSKSTLDNPYLVAFYPHNEHANSILIPQAEDIAYLAAHDHFYKKMINPMGLMAWLTAATIPVVRRKEDQGPSAFKDLVSHVEKAFAQSQKVGIYPQGTRGGKADTPEELAAQLEKNKGTANLSARFQAPVIPVGFLYPSVYQPAKGGETAEKRIIESFRGKKAKPVTVKVVIGEPIPPLADRQNAESYMSGLAFILWGMVHHNEPVQPHALRNDFTDDDWSEFTFSSR